MKKQHIILLFAILLVCSSASAQYKKSLPNMRGNGQAGDARVNIGLIGGGNFTTWVHFNSAQAADWYLANYKPVLFNKEKEVFIGYFGGLSIEYMLNKNLSVSLNAVYDQHNVGLRYLNENFPTSYNQHIKRNYELSANYRSVEVYLPISYYFNIGLKSVMPYVFVAPRASYILDGTMAFTRTDMTQDNTIINSMTQATTFNDSTYRRINVGATVGVGTQVRITAGNYYFLVKFDVSANVNALQTFTEYDLQNEFNHLRYAADAQASITLMLPLKKQLQGACMKWGKYD